jgi:hypothetical protein
MIKINCKVRDCNGWYDLDADEYHYCVRQYRFNNSVTVWVGDQYGNPKRTRTVFLRLNIFRSPAERIRKIRQKYQRIADKLNHKEMYLNHEVGISR